MAVAQSPPESGTEDRTYDLVTVTHLCLENVWRLERYARDAEGAGDKDLATLFRRMEEHSRKGAEECKSMLRSRLN